MKKTIALILAIVMMAALAVPAFAETPAQAGVTTETVNSASSNNCTVTYGVSQTYTVSLPSAVNFAFSKDPQNAVVSVTSLVIDGTDKLVVTIDSANEGTDNGWKMICVGGQGSDPVPYKIQKSAPTVANGGHVAAIETAYVANAVVAAEVKATTILEVNSNVAGAGGSVNLQFTTEGTSQAGDYSDTITFGMAIAEQ